MLFKTKLVENNGCRKCDDKNGIIFQTSVIQLDVEIQIPQFFVT